MPPEPKNDQAGIVPLCEAADSGRGVPGFEIYRPALVTAERDLMGYRSEGVPLQILLDLRDYLDVDTAKWNGNTIDDGYYFDVHAPSLRHSERECNRGIGVRRAASRKDDCSRLGLSRWSLQSGSGFRFDYWHFSSSRRLRDVGTVVDA